MEYVPRTSLLSARIYTERPSTTRPAPTAAFVCVLTSLKAKEAPTPTFFTSESPELLIGLPSSDTPAVAIVSSLCRSSALMTISCAAETCAVPSAIDASDVPCTSLIAMLPTRPICPSPAPETAVTLYMPASASGMPAWTVTDVAVALSLSRTAAKS